MHNKKLIRTIAIVLAILLVGGVVFSALVSALAEAQMASETGGKNVHDISMEYLPDEQALHITQRLLYMNTAGVRLNEVVFYAAGNMFRRESALMYEQGDLESVFFAGYAPAGIDLQSVLCDGEKADYGFQGEQELYLRVACRLDPGETCLFEFDYYLLLMVCGAFQGVGNTDVRLSAFCFAPGHYNAGSGSFDMKSPVPFTDWMFCDPADYRVDLVIPENCEVCASGIATGTGRSGGRRAWHMEARDVREFALAFGRRWRVFEGESADGIPVRVFCNVRGAGREALKAAIDALDQCREWFGPYPGAVLNIVQSDYPLGMMVFPGMGWFSEESFSAKNREVLAHRIRFCVAKQYFGVAAAADPVADAWLSDSVCEYVACLLLESQKGKDAFLAFVNRDWVSALQQTVPGGLRIISDAGLFDAYSYDIVVRKRGAVVFHELRLAMGLEALLSGLKGFYEMGKDGHILEEMDLVHCMDRASGKSWEAFLTDWVFNVGEYAQQNMTWYE